MKRFSNKDPFETILIGFDFSKLLDLANEHIITTQFYIVSETDPLASNMFLETPKVQRSVVSHLIQGGVSGSEYKISCNVTTNLGQKFKMTGSLLVKEQ